MQSKVKDAFRAIVSVSIALWIVYEPTLFEKPIVSPIVDLGIQFFTTLVSYEVVSAIVFKFLDGNDTFQKIIWGKRYIGGFWVFTSQTSAKESLRGIWRIDQSLDGVKVIGFGLDQSFGRRTRVHSVSPLMEVGGLFEVVNRRNDWEDTDRNLLSVSTFSMDAPKRAGLFRYPVTLRGETAILGGPRDGVILKNAVWRRCVDAQTEEDAIAFARSLSAEEGERATLPSPRV